MNTEITAGLKDDDDIGLTIRDIITQNEFADNNGLLDQEITELESLYALSKGLLTEEAGIGKVESTLPRRLGTADANPRRNMMFITNQTANLINLRKLKLDLIKQKADLKRDQLDRNIKALIQINKDKTGTNSELFSKALMEFVSSNVNFRVSLENKPIRNIHEVDAELDRVLHEEGLIIDEDDVTPITSEKASYNIYYDEDHNTLICEESTGIIYLIDADYQVIRELTDDDVQLEELDDDNLLDVFTNTIIPITREG